MLSLQCPKCGATVIFDEDHIGTFCTFCGAHLGVMTDYTVRAANVSLDKQVHKMNMEIIDKHDDYKSHRERANRGRDIREIIIIIAGISPILLGFTILLIMVLK